MPEQSQPSSPQKAPDPARSYERAKPEAESGMGRLVNDKAVPAEQPDGIQAAVPNAHPPHQLNADDVVDNRDVHSPGTMPPPAEVDHSMLDEEPDGWDLAPTDIKNPRDKRHPRTEGKGGTP